MRVLSSRQSQPQVWFAPLIALGGFLMDRVMHLSPIGFDGVIAAQVAFLVWSLSGRLAAWLRLFVIAASGGGTLVAVAHIRVPANDIGMAIGGACHLLVYSALLIWFVLSLRPGREPVITSFARQVRTSMPIEVVRYTRAVTWAWCIFFAVQLLVSLLLAAIGRYDEWSAFVNVWNLPLVAVMALGEFGVRSRLFPRGERTGLLATLAALRQVSIFPSRPR